MTIVGHITRIKLYEFKDGTFTFHTARQTDGNSIVFRSKLDTWPSARATAKNISYKLLVNSSHNEIQTWLNAHPDRPVINTTNKE